MVVLCRHGNSYCTILWSLLQRGIHAESSFSSNAHGSTIPDRADIIDKFIPNKVSRDTTKMTTSGSQRGKRVKMLVVGAPRMSWGCVRYVEGRCVALVWFVRWISRSFCFDGLTAGKGRGGGKVMCEQYYVVGRERDVSGALQTWQLVLYHPVVAPATWYPRRVVILEQRAWIYDPRQG